MQGAKQDQLMRIADVMEPITLDEMKSIRLMNRTDTKFVTNVPMFLRLLEMAKDKYYIQVVNDKRVSRYRTVYWDEPQGHEMYRRHESGRKTRTKVRVRTYVDSDLTFLEIKKKDNHGKTQKSRVQVTSIPAVMETAEGEDFLHESTGYSFARIKPAVGNHFNRITLVNKGKTERLTIDFDLQFDNFETGTQEAMDNIVVVELKRDGRVYSPILEMLRDLRIKPLGFSKYCIGSALTNPSLPINLLKERLHRIDKIAHATNGQ